jgi:heat shock protein HtpX
MIHQVPRFLFMLTWLLIGPSTLANTAIILMAEILILAIALTSSFRYRTVALLGVLGIMLVQSYQSVLISFHLEFLEPHLFHEEIWNFFSTIFTLDLTLTIIGAIAAACAAAYIELGKSRMSVTQIFPKLRFLDAPTQLRNMVATLARSAGIQAPTVSLVDSGTPSAFTIRTHRKYVVAVSIGLLESLNNEEVEACLAHEISHLKNKDFTWRFVATVAKVALFAKPLSYLIEPAVYRAREFLADRTATMLIGGPRALISALSKLAESQSVGPAKSSETVCMCNLNGGRGFFGLLGKHPDIYARIRALQEMST